VPVGERTALLVPKAAVTTRSGIDFVGVEAHGEIAERAVVIGEVVSRDDGEFLEILTGLVPGDVVVVP
jgi:hypothetical protein